MASKDRAQQLRDDIALTVEDFVPATDARRVMADVDELVEMIREMRRAQISSTEFS